jgi:nucleoside 2-deoxyribosyltransferase
MYHEKGYIAHPVLARKMVRDWSIKFEEATGIDLVNPFVDVEREPDEDLHKSESGNYNGVDSTAIVLMDLEALNNSDFVVAWVTGQRSYGTIMEICYAYQAKIPVYIICTNGHEDHPWLRYHATVMFTDPRQFTIYMRHHHGRKS